MKVVGSKSIHKCTQQYISFLKLFTPVTTSHTYKQTHNFYMPPSISSDGIASSSARFAFLPEPSEDPEFLSNESQVVSNWECSNMFL